MICSTVGLEALLYEKPVLTLGQPFYSGYGVTLDVDSFREIRAKVPELLRFRPDPERDRRGSCMRPCARACPGAPVLVDRSQENALRLAGSIEEAATRRRLAARSPRDRVKAVLFWDIDGTLLTTARAGVFSLEARARGGERRAGRPAGHGDRRA